MKTTIPFTSRLNERKRALVNAVRSSLRASLLFLVALGTPVAWAQPYSIWDNSAVPAIAASGDTAPVSLGLRFRSSTNGSITGIRFYKAESNTGPHTGFLWTSAGGLLGSVLFENETASGWQQQALSNSVPITANTTYLVSYYAPAGNYSLDFGYFLSAFDNPPLRALADGEDGPNGVYSYSSFFPDQTVGSANYWVDVVFEPEQTGGCEGDTNPPILTIPCDVVLTCADCDTDPENTGTATATDDCGEVTICYTDYVCGDCPKVVKRTWKATDTAGNTACGVQTITCLPSNLVTDSSLCIFDRDRSTPEQDFRLIFTQDPQSPSCYKIAASNPGQFFYNVFYTGTPGDEVTFDLTLPYPFVTQGANPIHAYDGVTVLNGIGQVCLAPGNAIFVSSQQVTLASYGNPAAGYKTIQVTLTVPSSGVVYLNIHLDYGLKKIGGFTRNANNDAVDCATGTQLLVPDHAVYDFSVGGAQTGSASVESYNSFKKNPGVAGLTLYNSAGDPVSGATVTLLNSKRTRVGSGTTDEDGFYSIVYKHTGKAATYSVSIVTPPPAYRETKKVSLKANAFVQVDFLVP